MSTIDSKELIRTLLENNGVYETDPQAHSVWSYLNDWGQRTCAVFWHKAHVDIYNSPYVRDPELLWSQDRGITYAGRLWLQENKES